MSNIRLIARLDIKGPNLIKGIQLEGVRKVGNPNEFAVRYYEQGVDEILFMDAVASLYDRGVLYEIVRNTAENVFVPITVGGGIRSVEDAAEMLYSGADKIVLNTAATHRPELITEIAKRFGVQCVVLQIDAKRNVEGRWEVYRDGGRERTGIDVIDWAARGKELGAGEILLTSVDCEGMRKGFDYKLTRAVTDAVTLPVIASGGMGKVEHLVEAVGLGGADAVAMAHVLHYEKVTLAELRQYAAEHGVSVRVPA